MFSCFCGEYQELKGNNRFWRGLHGWRYCVVVEWDLTANFKRLVPTPFFGLRLRRQNVNRPPRQYRHLRRLILVQFYWLLSVTWSQKGARVSCDTTHDFSVAGNHNKIFIFYFLNSNCIRKTKLVSFKQIQENQHNILCCYVFGA